MRMKVEWDEFLPDYIKNTMQPDMLLPAIAIITAVITSVALTIVLLFINQLLWLHMMGK